MTDTVVIRGSKVEEIYKDIPGFEGYQASDRGNICNAETGRVLRPGTSPTGYQLVVLHGTSVYVHRMVLAAHLGLAPDGNEADHIDHDRANNRLSNLRWIPAAINRARKRAPRAYRHVTDETAMCMVRARALGMTVRDVADTFGVSVGTVFARTRKAA